jgi:hypothetical protein
MKIFKNKNEKRIQSWQNNLAQRLDKEATGDCLYKLTWLVRHLEGYIERWLAFARMENVTTAATLRNDVFIIVLAATNLIDERIACLDATASFPREEWKYFRNTLEWIQRTPDRSELKLISDTFESFVKKVPTASDIVTAS